MNASSLLTWERTALPEPAIESPPVSESNLRCENITAQYGPLIVCRRISITVNPGEIVALIGPNGAGKTSFLHSIGGVINGTGDVYLGPRRLTGKPAYQRARIGLATVPDNRGLFPTLTVAENIRLGARLSPEAQRAAAIEEALELFPILRERWRMAAGSMSGGEQQMLAIAKGLVGRPLALLLDEPAQGLAPKVVEALASVLLGLRAGRLPVLLVEQNHTLVEQVADRFVLIVAGQTALEGGREALRDRERIGKTYLTRSRGPEAPEKE